MRYLAVRYRLEPTHQQAQQLAAFAAACRTVWNLALEQRETAWRRQRQRVSWAEQCRDIKDLRAAFPFLGKVPASSLHAVIRDLDGAYRNWWSGRARKPRWKSAKKSPPAFRFAVHCVALITNGGRHLQLVKIGAVRARISRPLPGRPIAITVRKTGEHWFAVVRCEVADSARPVHAGTDVGIDLGIAKTVALSNGDSFDAPLANLTKLARLQRRVARRTKGSRRQRRARRAVARWHEGAANVRSDFANQIANWLTREHALIALENLNVAGMTRGNRGLNRELLARAFGQLRRRIEQKAQQTGTTVVAVNPAYTSQTCSACRHVARENRESQAVFRCVKCGHTENADINAAKNILTAGQAEIHARGVLAQSGGTSNREAYTNSTEASYV